MIDEVLLTRIANQQFKILGLDKTFADIPESGMIEVEGKKIEWYKYYKWDSMEQYEEWRKWAANELKHLEPSRATYLLTYIDLRYGFIVRYKKEGLLF